MTATDQWMAKSEDSTGNFSTAIKVTYCMNSIKQN